MFNKNYKAKDSYIVMCQCKRYTYRKLPNPKIFRVATLGY